MSAKRTDPLIEKQVSEYIVKELIGSGGMGVVYRAVQPLIGKQVAIKVLKTEFAGAQELVQRLLVEARAVNAIQHRGIIDIFGFGQLPDGRPYVVMELLHGKPLDVFIRERKKIPVDEAVMILDEMLAALGAAHRVGIVHRDLKPGNVFLRQTDDGAYAVKLLDFGIAKIVETQADSPLTQQGHILGTPEYMAPEQIRGEQVKPVTDLYSMGVIAFQMISGKLPFTGESTQVLFAHIEDEPPALSSLVPGLPTELEALVQHLLAKDPSQRLQSAEAVRKKLEPFLPRKVHRSKEFPRLDSGSVDAPKEKESPTVEVRQGSESTTELLILPEPLKPGKPWRVIGLGVAALVLVGGGLGVMMTRRGTAAPEVAATPQPGVTAPTPVREAPPPAPPAGEARQAAASEQPPQVAAAPPGQEAAPPSQDSAKEEMAPSSPPEPSSAAKERQLKRKTKVAFRTTRNSHGIAPVGAVQAPPAALALQPASDPLTRAVQLKVCFSLKQFDRRTQQKELLLARIDCLGARARVDNEGPPDASLMKELAQLREAVQAAETAGERMKVTLQLDTVQARYDQQHGRLSM